MTALKSLADWIWNIKALKGHRSNLAQSAIIGLAAWQWLSTSPEVVAVIDLPDIPAVWLATLTAYFAAQMKKFLKEHV